jgi:hypothetical protein
VKRHEASPVRERGNAARLATLVLASHRSELTASGSSTGPRRPPNRDPPKAPQWAGSRVSGSPDFMLLPIARTPRSIPKLFRPALYARPWYAASACSLPPRAGRARSIQLGPRARSRQPRCSRTSRLQVSATRLGSCPPELESLRSEGGSTRQAKARLSSSRANPRAGAQDRVHAKVHQRGDPRHSDSARSISRLRRPRVRLRATPLLWPPGARTARRPDRPRQSKPITAAFGDDQVRAERLAKPRHVTPATSSKPSSAALRQSASINASDDTAASRRVANKATTSRCFGPPTATRSPPKSTSSGPRIRTSGCSSGRAHSTS